MEASTTLYSVILLLGAAHGAFLAVALISVSTGHVVALRLLALLTLTFAVDLGINFLAVSGYLVHAPRLVFIESAAAFLYGPLLYLYVLALTSKQPWHFSTKSWLPGKASTTGSTTRRTLREDAIRSPTREATRGQRRPA